MEKLFQQSIKDLGSFYKFSEEDLNILEDVDKAAEELAVPEFEHYIKREVNPEIQKIGKKYGIFKIPVSKEYGGYGAAPIVAVLAKERMGQLGMGISSMYNVQTFICSLTLQHWGTEQQKEKYLKKAANGEIVLAFGLTEPEAGSDPESMKTTYEETKDGFTINGTKYLITNGSIADAMIIFAKSKEGKVTSFIIDTKSEGFSVAMHMSEKIGLFTSDTAMLQFDNLKVPKENIIGEIGKGMHVAYSSLVNGRMGVASACIGVIESSLNAVEERARERVQHGKPIGKHQLIQKHIAEIRQNLEMARWPVYFAALRKENFDKDRENKALIKEMDFRSSLAKKIASRLAFESADRAVQVFGGFGYSLLSPVGKLFLDSRVARIYEGTDEIHELKIAANVLGDDFKAFG